MTIKELVTFPQELQLTILSYSDIQSIGRMGIVNRYWNQLTQDNNLWKKLFPDSSKFNLDNIKKILDSHIITTFNDALDVTKKFISEIGPEDRGEFTCYFSDCLTTVFKFSLGVINREEPNLKTFYLFSSKDKYEKNNKPFHKLCSGNLASNSYAIQSYAKPLEYWGLAYRDILPLLRKKIGFDPPRNRLFYFSNYAPLGTVIAIGILVHRAFNH